MSRSTKLAAGVVLALAVAYPAMSWYFGKLIENIYTEQFNQQIAAVPYLKVIKQEYDRGLFDATQVVTIELPQGLFHAPNAKHEAAKAPDGVSPEAPATEKAPEVAAERSSPIQLTLTSKIKHGPLPGFSSLGAGSADSTLSFDPETQKTVDAAFAGKSPLISHTLFGFTGGGHSSISSPAFRYSSAEPGDGAKSVVSSEGMELSVDFSRGMARYTMDGSAPRLTVTDRNGGQFVLAGLKLSGTQQRIFDDEPQLYSGNMKFTLAEISLDVKKEEAEEATKALLKNVVYDVGVPVNGEFIDLVAKISAGEFKIAETDYGPAHYDFSLRHVKARKFADLNRRLMELYKKPPTTKEDGTPDAEYFAPLLEPLKSLVLDNTEFAIDRLGFNTPDGEVLALAKLKLINANTNDFDNFMLLLGKLDFDAELSAPEPLLVSFLQSGGERRLASPEQTLETLVNQGYIAKDGKMLKSKLAFHNSKITVNDKPLDLLNALLGSGTAPAPAVQ